jgi:endonuclease/exonuclease/phosphatase family metal-dependent hydrolase
VNQMATPFSVMTWNVENLFPPGSFVSPSSRIPVTEEQFDAKLRFLTDFVAGLDQKPDVIALQEIGGQNNNDLRSIEALQGRLGGAYPHRQIARFPEGRPITVAFLSRLELKHADDNILRFPPGPLASVPDFDGRSVSEMGRRALKVEVEPQAGIRIRLVAVHLKSKLLTFPREGGGTSFVPRNEDERAFGSGIALMRRAAEAVTVRSFINGEIETSAAPHTIILGDFNDEPLAATSQIFCGPADSDVKSTDQGDPVRLYNLVDSIPLRGIDKKDFLVATERFSRIHEGRGELIDHILVSKGLLLGTVDFIVKEVRSFVNLIAGQSVTNNPNERATSVAPDHAPVLARFEL